jgi:serine phosphatase RsbU (regulator of sigma subunit)
VPLTFAYAIVRFGLLDIRILLRKSLLYTAITAAITVLYALGIVSFNSVTRGTALADSPYFPFVFALVIVLLLEPLRQRLLKPVERLVFAERLRLEEAAAQMGEELTARPDLDGVVRDLVDRLPELVGLELAALYLVRDDALERAAGPQRLPARLPPLEGLHVRLDRVGGLARLADLERRQGERTGTGVLAQLAAAGIELVGELATPRRRIGLVLMSAKRGQIAFEHDELELLRGLLHQASLALETSLLLTERTRQAELDRELAIAASIQAALLPRALELAPGFEVAARCHPARMVGGDFLTQLPGPNGHGRALAYGDVSGKSVSGALVMMAAHEILNALALTASSPEELLRLANRRLYALDRRSFVALGYFTPAADGGALGYLMAGQPPPLKRGTDGRVCELPLPPHRLPLGALEGDGYRLMEVPLAPGEMVLGYSDGILEARSPSGEELGSERLAAQLARLPPEPEAVVSGLLAAVLEFASGGELYDDLTLVAIRRQPEVP